MGLPPPSKITLGNVQVFPETVSRCALLYEEFEALATTQSDFRNPVAGNSAPLFVKPIQNHNNPFNDNKVNPEHPHASFYQKLKDSYSQGIYNPYLDNVTNYHGSDSEDNECYKFFSTLTRADHAFYFSFSFMIYMHHPQG